MALDFTSRIERIRLSGLGAGVMAWVFFFAAVYCFVPEQYALRDVSGHAVRRFGDTLYFSIVTAATLGDSQISAYGWMRAAVAIEVLGGILIAGLAVNSIVSGPSRQLRRARRACGGWWVERASFSTRKQFYNFTFMGLSGGHLVKRGTNFDPAGAMHNTTYQGVLITDAFPTLLFMYENDANSVDYSEGIVKFTMHPNGRGKVQEYEGACYDKMGKRDQLVGKKILDKTVIGKLDNGSITETEKQEIISALFPSAA